MFIVQIQVLVNGLCLYQVSSLEKKVAELEHEILMNGDLKSKLRQENTQLVHRYSKKTGFRNTHDLFYNNIQFHIIQIILCNFFPHISNCADRTATEKVIHSAQL